MKKSVNTCGLIFLSSDELPKRKPGLAGERETRSREASGTFLFAYDSRRMPALL